MTEPLRILVHCGFHKTGTTSLQDFLDLNRAELAPYFDYYGKAAILNAGSDARLYSQRPFPWRLARFRRSFRRFLETLPEDRSVVISRETFAGGMPGHRRFAGGLMTRYAPAAIPLARALVAELRRKYGTQAQITLLYTTRDREDWIKSVHGHLLRSIRLRRDFPAFRAQFPALPDLAAEAEDIARALAPVTVTHAALEDFRLAPEGPARAVLDLMGVPEGARANLRPAPRANVGQPLDLRETFLQLNRNIRSKSALRARKNALLHAHWKGLEDVK